MNTAVQDTMVLLAGMIVAVLAAQAVLMLIFVIAFRKWCDRTGAVVDQVSRDMGPVLSSARELLAESREKISTLTANLNEISTMAKTQVTRLDGFLQDATERAQYQIVRLDQLLSNTMDRVDETTEAVQRGVVAPVRELSAVVAGVRTALQFFANRNRKTVERAHQDEEMFI
jgi:hypothetical protein